MKTWDIWMEGYSVTGQYSQATFVGSYTGNTFEEACLDWADTLEENRVYFDANIPSYWGCRLFDNEAEARLSFG